MPMQNYDTLFIAIRQKCQLEHWYGPDMDDPDRWNKYDKRGSGKIDFTPVKKLSNHPQQTGFAYPPATEKQMKEQLSHEEWFLLERYRKSSVDEILSRYFESDYVKAALAAGMTVVAVSTPLTRQRLHESKLLPPELIVDDPDILPQVVDDIIARHQNGKTE